MRMGWWVSLLVTAMAAAQEAAPFPEERPDPWVPAWELTLRGDRFTDPEDPETGFRRAGAQLRLRWTWEADTLRAEAGTRSAVGSDGNRLNAVRWDNQPSNGTQLDVALVELRAARERVFGSVRAGLQGAALLVSPGVWDANLRFLGVAASGGVRGAGGFLQEAGLRGAAGRVRTILGGAVDLAAAQAVVKADTGPFSWTAHAARWELRWTAGIERLRALPGADPAVRQRLALDALGAGGAWHGRYPLEARWFGYRNPGTREDSEELQLLAGSRERAWWPQFTFTWQRLSSTGTLYPVNGDEWWYYRSARGPRYEAALPLPGRWVAALAYVRQKADRETLKVTRTLLTLTRRF